MLKEDYVKNSQLRRDVDPSQSNDMEMILTPTDHLSPPSTMSRFSDSDTTSDVDYDGMNTGRDGASISSVGSSSSPPPEVFSKKTKNNNKKKSEQN